jgi:hypothetical protein
MNILQMKFYLENNSWKRKKFESLTFEKHSFENSKTGMRK